jgi:hypothetical protein
MGTKQGLLGVEMLCDAWRVPAMMAACLGCGCPQSIFTWPELLVSPLLGAKEPRLFNCWASPTLHEPNYLPIFLQFFSIFGYRS